MDVSVTSDDDGPPSTTNAGPPVSADGGPPPPAIGQWPASFDYWLLVTDRASGRVSLWLEGHPGENFDEAIKGERQTDGHCYLPEASPPGSLAAGDLVRGGHF